MDPFSYLSVLISIVLALGMTRVVAGIGEMLQARQRRRIYWVHAVWVFNLFLFLVIAWWIFYRWRNVTEWTYYLFLFVLIAPTILYLAAVVLFPPEAAQESILDYRAHYYANHRSFFILFGLWVPVDVIDSLLKGTTHFAELGWPYLASAAILTTVFTTAAISKNERVHAILAIYFIIHTILISF
ncbi:MAG: hypothetical protein ACXWGY_05055, partial [Chthoniobacterales bacterium]